MRIFFLSLLVGIIRADLLLASNEFKYDPKTSRATLANFGQVMQLKGRATATSTDHPQETILSVGHQIMIGDLITTGEKSLLKIKIVDDSLIVLGPNSKMVFEQLTFPNKEQKTAVYQFLQGQLQAHFTHDSKVPEAIKIRSKFLAMGIRGTFLLANARGVSSGERVEEVALLQGKVQISGGIDQALAPGEHIVGVFNGAGKCHWQAVRPIAPAQLQEYLKMEANQRPDEFGPLLDYYSYRPATSTTPGSTGDMIDPPPPNGPAQTPRPAGNWHETLRKLNAGRR